MIHSRQADQILDSGLLEGRLESLRSEAADLLQEWTDDGYGDPPADLLFMGTREEEAGGN